MKLTENIMMNMLKTLLLVVLMIVLHFMVKQGTKWSKNIFYMENMKLKNKIEKLCC